MSAFQKSGMRAAAAFACCAALTSAAVAATTIDGDHVFAASETLTDDVTVTGVATFAEGATVDVAGHRLTVHGIAGPGTVTSSAEGGVLDLCIADTCVLDSTTISGGANMQVWKTGAGFLHMMKVNTGFGTGGSQATPGPVAFVVKAGRVKKGNDTGNDSPCGGDAMYCGAGYCTIKVERGGQFDIAGRTCWDYNYDIAGDGPEDAPVKGALINTVEPTSFPWTWPGKNGDQYRGYLYNITLSDDASIGGSCLWTLNFWKSHGKYPPWLKLNGHTLTFASGIVYPGETRNYNGDGKIVIDNELRVRTSSPSVPGCDLVVNGIYQMEGGQRFSPVKSLAFSATGKYSATLGTPGVTVVYEKYAPNLPVNVKSGTLATHPPVQLGDASHLATEIDVSGFDSEFDASAVTFQAGSAVAVHTGARNISAGDRLLAWNAVPAEDVTFSLVCDGQTAEERNLTIVVKSDGLFVKSTLTPSYALRDLAAGRWNFYLEDGSEYPGGWTEGVTGEIEVRFSSFAEYQAIKELGVSPSRFLLTALNLPEGTAFYDMGDGMDFAVAAGLTIDVKGNRLRLPPSAVGGITAFSVTSSVAGGVFDIWVPEGKEIVNNVVSITGGADMQVWKTGGGKVTMLKVNSGYGTGGSYANSKQIKGPVSTIVKEGFMKKGNDNGSDTPNGANALFCGAAYSTIKVEAGAQFDIAGRTAWDYNYDIAGDGPEGASVKGALISSVQPSPNPWHWHNNHGYLYDITLSADASIGGAGMWALHWYNNGTCYTYMNGHRLTFACGHIYVGQNRHFDGGELYVAPGATCNAYNGVNANAAGMTFRIDGEYRTESFGISPVKSFLFGATGVLNADSDTLQTTVVHDTYAPNLNAKSTSKIPHPKVQLGAAGHTATTLDLTLFGVGDDAFDAGETLTFHSGSRVSVRLPAGVNPLAVARSANPHVMMWSAPPKEVAFALPEELVKRGFRLVPCETGLALCYFGGTAVFVR
ncbi:MAG: hypothetical protein IKL96_12035 [Kiritimatiellae bacterium]|nr:hypothetical protein [Kiritimatiellia bacterium]